MGKEKHVQGKEKKGKAEKGEIKKIEEKKPAKFSFPMVPDDSEVLASEMREMFEEDEVKHQHGETEPERD